MKILICGADGMVGKNLVEKAPKNVILLTPDISTLNLLDYQQTINYLQTHKPDAIIHAAGIVGGIHANIAQPVKFLLENTEMGKNLVWSAFNSGIKQFINLGSSCMYPRNAENPLQESMILTGELEPTNEAYAIAKIFTQRLIAYITREHPDYQYKTVIPCNLYGKYDKFDPKHSHMIPAVIRKLHEARISNAKTVEIWGDGTARREFMYAGDLAEMIWHLILIYEKTPPLMNLGLGYDYSINEYYQIIADVIGFDGVFKHDLSKPVGMKQKLVDIRLQESLALKPKHSLKEGIEKTYQYFKTQIL
ncbi:MAG: NAD-dependent epimerase/dehydratase family protein [Salinivirgaceae bacterium]|nr:NAD-dependent epimerase/dehydratase family protein [Salinivirgaceae bacterium]